MQLASVTSVSPLEVQSTGDTVPVPAVSMGVLVVVGDAVLVENIENTVYVLHGSRSPIPAGAIEAWPSSTAPAGWLICDFQAVSRTTYAELNTLAAAASYTGLWGPGDGSTTFNVPDGKKRALIGAGSGLALGTTDGLAEGSRTLSLQHNHPVPSQAAHTHTHTHVHTMGAHDHPLNTNSNANSGGSLVHVTTTSTGNGGGSTNTSTPGDPETGNGGVHDHGGNTSNNTAASTPHAVVNFIIKAG